jgi:Family of unknown function (DUF6412)
MALGTTGMATGHGAVVRAVLAWAAVLASIWPAAVHPAVPAAAPSGLLALAALSLAGMALAFFAHAARIAAAVTAQPLTGRATALRRKSYCAVFQRQLNPDAAGHIRPRAPSAAPAAA